MLLRSTLAVAVVSSMFVATAPASGAAPAPLSSRDEADTACTIVGTPGRDVLRGTSGDDVICAGAGADRIHGGGGDDVVRGGRGDDVLIGGAGDDVLWGAAGDDRLKGRDGTDVLRAGRGADVLRGGRGRDLLDARHGGTEDDRLSCGTGSDTAVADESDVVSSSCEVVRRPPGGESPSAVADALGVAEDSGTSVVDVLANDLPGDRAAGTAALTVAALTQPRHGTSTLVDGGASVAYRPAPDYCSTAPRAGADVEPDTFTYQLAPGGSSATVRVTVACADDAPVAVDDVTSVVEDDDVTEIPVLANDLDVDGGPLAIDRVSAPRLGTVTVVRDGAALAYRPAPDICTTQDAPDSFTYTLNGGSTAEVDVLVACGDDVPRILTSDGAATYVEDAPATVVDPGVDVGDPDGTLSGATVRITSGLDAANDVLALTGSHPGITATGSAGVLRLDGAASVGAYRSALRAVTFRSGSEAPSTATRVVTVEVVDATGGAAVATRTLSVEAVNDAPVNTVPGAQTTPEDTTLTLAGAQALAVGDVDASSLQVTLAVEHGTLTLDRTTGLTFADGTGTDDPEMTFVGTETAVDAALDGLVYRPAADRNGADELTVVTSDLGASGTGGTRTDTDVVALTVTPVNDAPSFTAGPNQTGVANKGTDNAPVTYTVDPWATAVSAGPGEGNQTTSFEIVADNESLFDAVPTVSPSGVLRFTPDPAATGTATVLVRVVDDGGTASGGVDASATQLFTIDIVEPGPRISSVSPSTLVPGASATLTGRGFSPTPADNTVTIGGTAASVTAATSTSLTVTVPCVSSGSAVAVAAKVGTVATNTVQHPLQVVERDLGVGESLILDSASQLACNELAATGTTARYLVAAYSASTSPTSNSPFTLSGAVAADPTATPDTAGAPPAPASAGAVVSPDHTEHEGGLAEEHAGEHDEHTELLEANREQYQVLREEFGTDGVQRRGAQTDMVAADLPMTRSFRISNINAAGASTICNSYYAADATRVYAEGKLVIYEDDATRPELKAANNPAMADYYERIGDQFNSDMEPIIRDNFGDILRRDAVTDNNGVMIALSTPRINTSFSGVAGFVVTCDQFPNDDLTTPAAGGPYTGTGTNGASNFGEFFYLYQPTSTGTGTESGTVNSWYRTVRSTFIHESKHVASQAARVANNAPAYEAAWLEEGTARLAEELWARQAVDTLPWKANNGYGSASNPVSLYCDLRPSAPECESNPRRPASVMQRHFTSLYTNLFGSNARLLSPFGATASDNASYYYAVSWSLVRYAIDRYAGSEAEFLTALTQSTSSGATNLAERTGVANDQLLGRWVTALALDDRAAPAASTPDMRYETWNLRSIYAGLNQDLPGTYTLPYPVVPAQFGFGSFTATAITTLRGGGVLWYELSGTQTKAQLLRVQGSGGTVAPSTLRLAITRVE